jgi:predicted ester cyclase
MAVEKSKEALRRVYAAMNAHDPTALTAVIAPEFSQRSFPHAHGPEAFAQVFGMFIAAFPDFHVAVEEMIAEGDKVAARGSFTGTHGGDFMSIPATGKRIKVDISEMWRFVDDKAVENWVQMDTLGMMQQLGVAPMPEQTT